MIALNFNNFKHSLTENKKISIKSLINCYYKYIDCNNYDDIRCPCCHKNTLSFHKTYERNITYIKDDNVVNELIDIAVVVCDNCKKINGKQKYHSILPGFISPYQIYSTTVVISVIYQRLVDKLKIEEILNKIKISHKLFYDWLKKFNNYLLSSSIVLKENVDKLIIIKKIYLLNEKFLTDFYERYNHPYFLFKLTCVPLCIIH